MLYLIGKPEAFKEPQRKPWLTHDVFYRLRGEQPNVWHTMSRPDDYVARRVLGDWHGTLIEEVYGHPDWLDDYNSKPSKDIQYYRFNDGPCCSTLHFERFRRYEIGEIIEVIVESEAMDFLAAYYRLESPTDAAFIGAVPRHDRQLDRADDGYHAPGY
jgi:hypothetical protein